MLSIIIPTLNEERYLPILLSQIKKQDFKDYEIIVADGGSKDNTVEIAKGFSCKVVQGGKPAKGRNEGAKIARGELLLFMDADNIYLPDGFLKKLISEFERKKLGVASFPIYPAGNFLDKVCYFFYNLFVFLTQKFSPFATNSILIRKEVFEKVGGFDETIFIGEDHDLARRAAKISKFGFIKIEPILTSARRFEREGRIKTYLKYLLAGLHILFFGPIRKEIFKYDFEGKVLLKEEKKIKIKSEETKMEKLSAPGFKVEYLKLKPGRKNRLLIGILILLIFGLGFLAGFFGQLYFGEKLYELFPELLKSFQKPKVEVKKEESPKISQPYIPETSQEEKVIKVVKEVSPGVVSVIVTKDIPKLKLYYENPFKEFGEFFEFRIPIYKEEGYEKKEIGGGTAFFISKDGLLLTNAHVVLDEKADYTVLTNDGKKYPAKVLARDRIRDLAILKVEGENFPELKLGDSDKLEVGQTVIAIGNALGEFRNTVSVGVISGLGRRVTASGGGVIETLDDVIQTDAAINPGNSGGPLLNLKGEVIGVNFAMASGAENIGFAIPINQAKKDVEQVRKFGKLKFPFLGVRYITITEEIQKKYKLPVNYGAIIVEGNEGEPAIIPGSEAERIGLREGDIILEVNGEKITPENPLGKVIFQYNPGDKISLKVLREGKEKIFEATLREMEK